MRIRIINHYLVRLLLIIAAALLLLEGLGTSVLLIDQLDNTAKSTGCIDFNIFGINFAGVAASFIDHDISTGFFHLLTVHIQLFRLVKHTRSISPPHCHGRRDIPHAL